MKHLLLLLLLLPVMGNGQKIDTTDVSKWTISYGGTLIGLSDSISYKPKYDTVRCVMLVCDTAKDFTSPTYQIADGQLMPSMYHYIVIWQFGYEIREVNCCTNGYTGEYGIWQPVNFYTHVGYLDDKKRELPKSVIVWMSKEY